MKNFLLGLLIGISSSAVFSQSGERPADYLNGNFYKERRDAFRKLMPVNSVAAIFTYPIRNFSNDVDYVYHQNPDLYYLTGYTEPESLLLIFKEPQHSVDGKTFQDLFFVQKRDPEQEMVTGKRLGVEGVKNNLGLDMVFENTAFSPYNIDFAEFNELLFDAFPDDVRDDLSDSADLFDLIKQFKKKANINDSYNKEILEIYDIIKNYDNKLHDRVLAYVNRRMKNSSVIQADTLLSKFVHADDSLLRAKVVEQISNSKNPPVQFNKIMTALREIKTNEEMVLLKKAIDISCIGHAEVMKAVQPGMSEREVQGIHEFVHKKYGAENVGYPSIVGAGNNGCILHYVDNCAPGVGNNLLLMDVGAEYHGYSADITRTIPANGKFTPEQLSIYNIVYRAQEEAFKICKEGISFDSLEQKTLEVITKELKLLGVITEDKDARIYYPHGVSHHIGLDVHDKGSYDILKSGMIITVEPGVYIPEGSKCDKKWWGIGVRIEDDVLITKGECKLLSTLAPRRATDVEKMISRDSPLDHFALPALKE